MFESPILWREDLVVAFAEFDRQHQDLVRCIRELHAAIGACKPKVQLEQLLASLVEATGRHFTAEECWMLASGYPAYDEHRSEHTRLLAHLRTIQHDLSRELITPDVVIGFTRVLTEQHIILSDKPLAKFLNEAGFGK